jgi:hypothetical protein
MITQERTPLPRPVRATRVLVLAAAAALVIAGCGSATRAESRLSGAAAEEVPGRIANPGIGLHKADAQDTQPPATASVIDATTGTGPGRNPGIGLHRADTRDAE